LAVDPTGGEEAGSTEKSGLEEATSPGVAVQGADAEARAAEGGGRWRHLTSNKPDSLLTSTS
jgi:hypothetical protein